MENRLWLWVGILHWVPAWQHKKEIPAAERGRNSINLNLIIVSESFPTSFLPGMQNLRTRASGDPVTLNGHPQEPPLCGMQEDTPVKWWPGPKGSPSPKPSLRSIYLNSNMKRLECINMPNFFFFYSEIHFSNRILNKTQLKQWSWSERGASKSPFCIFFLFPNSLLRNLSKKQESPTEQYPSLLWHLIVLLCTRTVQICRLEILI